jgi:hypothetical protein
MMRAIIPTPVRRERPLCIKNEIKMKNEHVKW